MTHLSRTKITCLQLALKCLVKYCRQQRVELGSTLSLQPSQCVRLRLHAIEISHDVLLFSQGRLKDFEHAQLGLVDRRKVCGLLGRFLKVSLAVRRTDERG